MTPPKDQITLDDDKNRRDRDNKPDREDVIRNQGFNSNRRSNLDRGGKTQGRRNK